MTISVNNSPTSVADEIDNVALLIHNLYPDTVDKIAVAKDNRLVMRSAWESTKVSENDEFTIITAAFGG